MVDSLSAMPELRSGTHLHRKLRLSCMCLTRDTPLLPPIRFHDVDAHCLRCRFGDVLFPVRSSLARVPNSVFNCTSETSFSKLRDLEDKFNTTNVKAFGRAVFQTVLSPTYKTVTAEPKTVSPDICPRVQVPFLLAILVSNLLRRAGRKLVLEPQFLPMKLKPYIMYICALVSPSIQNFFRTSVFLFVFVAV